MARNKTFTLRPNIPKLNLFMLLISSFFFHFSELIHLKYIELNVI